MSDLLPWFMPWSGRALVLVSMVAGFLIARAGWRGSRIRAPQCPQCGYGQIGAESSTCPECGHSVVRGPYPYRPFCTFGLVAIGLMVAVSLPVYVGQERIREFGWDYYLRLEPFYSIFGQPVLREQERGPFTVTIRQDRRGRTKQTHIRAGDKTADKSGWHWPIYAWRIDPSVRYENDGRDLNSNGRPNLVMTRHHGGNTDIFRIYELIGNGVKPILEVRGSPGWIEGPGANGMHYFRGDLERQPYAQRWVKIPLIEGGEPIDTPPPSGNGSPTLQHPR